MKNSFFKDLTKSDILTVIELCVTTALTISIIMFTVRSENLDKLSISKGLVNQFDLAVIESKEAQLEISKLRKPPNGFSKVQEHLLFIYLNHLEFAFNLGENDGSYLMSAIDCLSYFKNSPEALNYMLNCGYPEPFMRSLEKIYKKNFNENFALSSFGHPSVKKDI